VLRGPGTDPKYAPARGYRYDGLYYVRRYSYEDGVDGFRICQFLLVRDGVDEGVVETLPPGPERPAPRARSTVQRIVRNTEMVRRIKTLYCHRCQLCGVVLATKGGAYAEGAHIRPLGLPHDGPDVAGNVLCLCPNDHVRFDGLSICITDDLRVLDVATRAVLGGLSVKRGHAIDPKHLAYHRRMCGIEA
jgi:putative restriction endonuclease